MPVQELAKIWDIGGPPRVHHSMDAVEVGVSIYRHQEGPESQKPRVSCQVEEVVGDSPLSVEQKHEELEKRAHESSRKTEGDLPNEVAWVWGLLIELDRQKEGSKARRIEEVLPSSGEHQSYKNISPSES